MILRRLYSPDDSGGAGSGNDGKGGAQTGDDDGGGGANAGDDDGDDGAGDDDKPVSRADHKRAIDDLNRFKKKAADAEKARLAAIARAEDLERKNKGEDVDSLKQRAEAAEAEKETLKQRVVTSEKHRQLLPALTAAGLRADAHKILTHLDLEELEVEFSTHGNITVHGVDDFVKRVKKEYPFAFESKKAPTVNSGGGGNRGNADNTEWTPQKLDALERECKKKGDMAPYRAAMAKYLEQKQAKK